MMADLTEQQEQEMIERARAGDPEANYQMSLWALAQGEVEPEEERWNRLAAKCLVKAAEAGYEPAKEKMDELLAQTAAAAPQTPPAPPAVPKPEKAASAQEEPAAPGSASEPEKTSGPSAFSAALADVGAKLKGLFSRKKSGDTGEDKSVSGRKPGFLNFSEWDSAKWKKMQIVCIVICAVLILLIVIMLATRGGKKKAEAEELVPTPIAETVATPEPVISTPEPAAYPAEETREEIASANLEVFPEDGDYVTEAKTVIVSTSGSVLNLRRGPGQSYGQVSSMPNGTSIDVYAYKNGWALVKYEGTWGWCSNDYLK